MASKHRVTVGEELRYDSDVQGLKNLSGTYARKWSAHVRDYGAVGDGVTNDTAAFAAAIAALGSRGGTVQCDPLPYRVENLAVTSNIRIRGAKGGGRSGSGTTLRRTGNSPIITVTGTSILSGGPQVRDVEFFDLRIEGNDLAAPLFDIKAASGVRWWRCFFYGVTGQWVKALELYDSRFLDCDFEWGGSSDGTVYGIELGSGGGYEYTNQIHFMQCRFESYRGTALGTSGSNTNEIFFQSCKFESIISTGVPHLVFASAVSLGFFNVQITCGGAGASIPSLVKFASCNTLWGSLLMERAGSTMAVAAYVELTTSQNIDLSLIVYSGSPTPTGGFLVNWDGANSATTMVNSPSDVSVPIMPSTSVPLLTRQNWIRQIGSGAGAASTAEVVIQQKRGDVSDTWGLGRIILDGSGSAWRMLHDANEIFRIQNDNSTRWKFGWTAANVSSTLAANGAVSCDCSKGNVFFVTLQANATSSALNFPAKGQEVTLAFVQDSTGGRTYAWPANAKFAGGSAPSDTAANKTTFVKFLYDGTNLLEMDRGVGLG